MLVCSSSGRNHGYSSSGAAVSGGVAAGRRAKRVTAAMAVGENACGGWLQLEAAQGAAADPEAAARRGGMRFGSGNATGPLVRRAASRLDLRPGRGRRVCLSTTTALAIVTTAAHSTSDASCGRGQQQFWPGRMRRRGQTVADRLSPAGAVGGDGAGGSRRSGSSASRLQSSVGDVKKSAAANIHCKIVVQEEFERKTLGTRDGRRHLEPLSGGGSGEPASTTAWAPDAAATVRGDRSQVEASAHGQGAKSAPVSTGGDDAIDGTATKTTRREERLRRRASALETRWRLWIAAVKLPMYTVAVIPLAVGAALGYGSTGVFMQETFMELLAGSVMVLGWLNLSNDGYDAETGVDANKSESVVNLTKNKEGVLALAWALLAAGVGVLVHALSSTSNGTICLALLAAAISCGWAYQCPPLRLSYRGLGEALCFAFRTSEHEYAHVCSM